jgi:hypothetical protein
MLELSRVVIIFGVVLVIVGLFLSVSDRIPLIGRLPGDILIRRNDLTFYFPLTTSLLLSIVLSFFFRFLSR